MNDYPYTVEELRASVEQGTQQIECGHYYTDAQVNTEVLLCAPYQKEYIM